MVGNVGWHEMDEWVNFYANVMGFSLYQHFDDTDISTEYSALMSKVMANGNGYVKFPINEPAEGKKKSQIEEYLDFYPGPGVQHIALATDDILHTVTKLHEQGIEFLHVPHTYYTELQGRVGTIDEPVEQLVIPKDVTHVLAEETLDALAEFLHALDVHLLHAPGAVRRVGLARLEGLDLLLHTEVPGDVGDEVSDRREGVHRLDRDRLLERQVR